MIVAVGMLLGVGVLTLDKFGTATKESLTILNESFTVPAANATVTLNNGNITSFTKILNASGGTWSSSSYSVDLTLGVLNNTGNTGACTNGSTCYAYYIYDEYDTDANTALSSGRDAISEIGTTWLGLIITIIVLSLILGLVIKSFNLNR